MSDLYKLAVCYYPEHWPQDQWARDAVDMYTRGIRYVRIGEFSWSRVEPQAGHYNWDWLDRAFDVLHEAGLKVILGTPTATPPKWLIDAHSGDDDNILAVDASGAPRRFGSRRHYCFSSKAYAMHSARITETFAKRYGHHRALYAWQTDNEYGCHDTTRSYSKMAQGAFREWLANKYESIEALNRAWGTVFWSMEFTGFAQIDLPDRTVTEANPSQLLDFARFSSDQVAAYNAMQCTIIRAHSAAPISHNFMGYYGEFDHFKVSQDLDITTWDSYPLGFLDIGPTTDVERHTYLRQGHPDFASFHHDLYRGCKARWWVMEQQPGPVNWADHNPAPKDGMVRLWSWEAFAHGAQGVSFFRYRQAPFAQEQFHAGLKRIDNSQSQGGLEVALIGAEKTAVPQAVTRRAKVALVFSYEALWMFEIQPQGKNWNYWRLTLEWYAAARTLGLDVDIVSEHADLSGYALVLAPSLPIISDDMIVQIKTSKAHFIFGARSGSKTQDFHVPHNLAPGPLQELIDIKITHSESLRDGIETAGGGKWWLDHVQTPLSPQNEAGTLYTQGNVSVLTTVITGPDLSALIKTSLKQDLESLPEDLRVRRRGDLTFAFNYGNAPISLPHSLTRGARLLLGDTLLEPAGVACWRES